MRLSMTRIPSLRPRLILLLSLLASAAAAQFAPVEWGSYTQAPGPVPAGLTNVTQVSGGSGHALALGKDGTVTGWGDNSYRQLNIPAGLSNVIAVAAGDAHSLALKAD